MNLMSNFEKNYKNNEGFKLLKKKFDVLIIKLVKLKHFQVIFLITTPTINFIFKVMVQLIFFIFLN